MSNFSEKRKEQQELGVLPDWYSTAGYQMVCNKYLHKDSVKEQYETIAKTLARHVEYKKWGKYAEERFFDLLWKGWLSPSTPVLANTGTKRGFPVSCSGSYIDDSIDGFYSTRRETALLTKYGFGTSGYLGDIRPRGSSISIGSSASGILPVFKGFVRDMQEVAQGATRRGAWAGYLPIMHGDFDELCDYLHHSPDDLNVGWTYDDKFVEALDSGSEEHLRRWRKLLKVKMITGKGYLFGTDKASRLRPNCYKSRNLEVVASNLCVAPETLVLTDRGHVEIASLEGEHVNIWNGAEWSNVQVIKTGTNSELLKVHTDSGQHLECTPQHKFYVSTDYAGGLVEKRAYELVPGDKLIKLSTPILDGAVELLHPYANGFYSGDGCYFQNKSIIYLYHDKRVLLSKFNDVIEWHNVQEGQNREVIHAKGLQPKFFVPDSTYSVRSRVEWFSGLLDADGCLLTNGDSQTLQVGSVEIEFLKDIQLMLQTLGVQSKVKRTVPAGPRLLPMNDGSSESDYYSCKAMYRILVGGSGINQLLSLGMKTHRLQITNHVPNRNCERFVIITDVEYTGRLSDTFCFTEPKRHLGVFNGILTGQCTEIMLHSSNEYSFTCVLSSMNVSKYDEWKHTDAVYYTTIFLHCVALEFLSQAKGRSGFEKVVAFTEASMALGLGQCGFHTYLQDNRIPYESLEARYKSNEIAKYIREEAEFASQELGSAFGEAEWCRGTGRANTHLIAIAPTKSTALIMGGISEGINPDPAMVYTQTTSAGEVLRISPAFLRLLKEKGSYNEKTIKSITENFGSVQHLDCLDDHEKLVFRTAFEIDQSSHLRLCGLRQIHIDQTQSINLFFAGDATEEDISRAFTYALKHPSIPSIYYAYSQTGVSGSNDCVACQ